MVAAIAAVATIIAAVIDSWCDWFPSACEPTPTPTTTQVTTLPPELKIMSVQEGQVVQGGLDGVDGTYDRIPEGQQIWLIVMAGNLCYPQDGPAEMLRAGIWEHGPVEFPTGGEQQLRAALVSPDAAVDLRSAVGREGIRCDRSGVQVIDSVTVICSAVTPSASPPSPSDDVAAVTSEGPWVEILEPPEGLSLDQRRITPVQGKYGGFEEGDELWIAVFVGAYFYVQNGPAVLTPANGTWVHADVYVGEDQPLTEPKQFVIIPVVVYTPEDQRWFDEHKTGEAAGSLPDDVTLLPSTKVTRTR